MNFRAGGKDGARRAVEILTLTLATVAALFVFIGCSRGGGGAANGGGAASQPQSQQAQASPPRQPQPARVTPDDLRKLRWIEGAWRGTGDVEKPFYERYRFESETTLAVESFKDETLKESDDVTRFELRDGQFGKFGTGARWVATALDENSITFEPVAVARNSFRWERESQDVWKATLDWPAAEGKPARRRVYRMERLPQPK
jgi:hypothetical protein